MSGRYILSIDQGTTNTKALLVDADGTIATRASRPVPIEFPRPGWVEQDPYALWQSVAEAIDDCIEAAGNPAIDCVAITNQRESAVLWDRTSGKTCGPCVSWQCRRTASFCADLQKRGLEPLLRERTGLGIDPLFSAAKIRWLLDQTPDGLQRAKAGELCAGTVDSWLLWQMTRGRVHACDATNASRTQLLNIHHRSWDSEMLETFGIPATMLPEAKPSSNLYGSTAGSGRLPAGVPIAALIGDSHAAMFAHAACRPRAMKATYGTGSSLMKLTSAPVEVTGLSTTVAWSTAADVQYAVEGNITMTGGAVEWLGQFLGLADPARDVAALAAAVRDNGDVYLVPAFAGLGAPHWNDRARGIICGLTRGSKPAHVARATVESIAYQVRDVFAAMEAATGARPDALLADGGASRNDALMQFQADILDCPVIRNLSTDLSALGAAWLAGLATGFWRSIEELQALPRNEQRFEPNLSTAERERLYAGWKTAVRRAMHEASNQESQVHGAN